MYKLIDLSDSIRRLSDGASIPKDTRNRDYREYLEWLEAGNTPLPAYTEEELQEKIIQNCKTQAKNLIAKYDFAVLPDRSKDIQNIEEIITYRDKLLSLIKNPIENPEFPNPPEVIWKS